MVSVKSLTAGALLATVAVAQAPNSTFSSDLVMSLLNGSGPSSPDMSTRLGWCTSQMTLCDTLCLNTGGANPNMCEPSTLNWTCTCTGNKSTPALEYYPYSVTGNECGALKGNCFAATENQGQFTQAVCNSTYICGGATEADASAAAGAGSSSSNSGSGSSGSSGSASSSTPSNTAAATTSPSPTHNAAPSKYAVYGPGMGAMAVLGAVLAAL